MSMDRLLRLPEVKAATGHGKSKIYELVNDGELAPPVPTGPNSVAWLESEVSAYIARRVAERDTRPRRGLPASLKRDNRRTGDA
jgi:prophage regulatory protein